MGTPDSREFDRLKERNFRPYSLGHRKMYLKAILDIETQHPGRKVKVLEAGFGIGWGLEQMANAGILESYVGYEPNRDSFNYVDTVVHPKLTGFKSCLLNQGFEPNLDPDFDVAFCIEVIEHVPADHHQKFLEGLCRMAPTLYFSTPDIEKVPREGVRTTLDWVKMLILAGYAQVRTDTSEWTHLFKCTR